MKRVTSTDDSDVEDPDNEPTDPNGGNGSGTDNQGSGTNTSRQYTISVTSANTSQGTLTGGGTYSEGSRVNITATAKAGYVFDKWNDGNTSASRTVNVSKNESFVAQFIASTGSGTGSHDGGDSTGENDDPAFL